MKKPLIAMLAVGLVAASLAAPAQAAKKKKPKPKPKPSVSAPVQMDQKYYLVNSSGGCGADAYLLMLAPSEEATDCGSTTAGAVNTVLVESGAGGGAPCTPEIPSEGALCGNITYNAGEGLPLTLDATKKITGAIFVQSYTSSPVAVVGGAPTLNITVGATVNGEEKVLGTFSQDYTTSPTQGTYEVPFEITVDPALDKGEVTTFSLDLYSTGASALHGFYEVNTSNVVIPTWKVPAAG